MYMMTPFQIVFQSYLINPRWTWEDHALNLTQQGYHVCAQYGHFGPMCVRMWIRESRVICRNRREGRLS